MCYNCGCFNPQDDMGSQDNITEQTLTNLASHWGKPITETKQMLYSMLDAQDQKLEEDAYVKEMFIKAAKAWGQSVGEAKKNTLQLLKDGIKKINK